MIVSVIVDMFVAKSCQGCMPSINVVGHILRLIMRIDYFVVFLL